MNGASASEADGARLFGVDDALDSDAWYTPPWVFEGLGVTFDLDVASPADPPPMDSRTEAVHRG